MLARRTTLPFPTSVRTLFTLGAASLAAVAVTSVGGLGGRDGALAIAAPNTATIA